MTCRDSFRDGDRILRECQRPVSHDGLHDDGRGVRWNGSFVPDRHFDGSEDQ